MSLLIWTNAEFPPAETALLEAGIAPHRLVRSPSMSTAVLAAGRADPKATQAAGEQGGVATASADTFTVQVICDPKSYLYLNGTTIDFKDEIMGRGFVFNNPNATTTCGCGSSFSA